MATTIANHKKLCFEFEKSSFNKISQFSSIFSLEIASKILLSFLLVFLPLIIITLMSIDFKQTAINIVVNTVVRFWSNVRRGELSCLGGTF